MKKLFAICLLILVSESGAAAANILDKLPFLGGCATIHERRGFLDFGNNRIEEIEKNNLTTFGAELGKRWRLAKRLRVQAAVNINYGTVVDDTLSLLFDNESMGAALLTTALFYGGLVASLQYPFYASPDASWFVQGGGGAHIAKIRETEALLGAPDQRVLDDFLEEHAAYSASVHGGLGFEIAVSPTFGFAAVYSLRYWHPVRYGMDRDYFPLETMDYRERHFSHEIEFLLLVKRY